MVNDLLYLAPVEQKLSRARRFVVLMATVNVGRDVGIDKPQLPIPVLDIATPQAYLVGPYRLDLGASKHDACLEAFQQVKIEGRSFVVCDQFSAVPTPLHGSSQDCDRSPTWRLSSDQSLVELAPGSKILQRSPQLNIVAAAKFDTGRHFKFDIRCNAFSLYLPVAWCEPLSDRDPQLGTV